MIADPALLNLKPGDQVLVEGWPPSAVLKVVDTSDRSLVILRTPNGALLKIGRLAVVECVESGNPSGH
jgi:acyl CoA:acetate/3-ketoacid CoA transferase alpha subunit